jgi:hypothetical protein
MDGSFGVFEDGSGTADGAGGRVGVRADGRAWIKVPGGDLLRIDRRGVWRRGVSNLKIGSVRYR